MGRISHVLLAIVPMFFAAVGGTASGQRTERVSVDSAGSEGDDVSGSPKFSADGRFVSFTSLADNLVAGDSNRKADVFVHDRLLGTTERVSIDSNGTQGNGDSFWSAISADGSIVAFASYASNLVSGDTNGRLDIFVRDRQTGITERVSVDSSGNQADQESYAPPAISGDGILVEFASVATNLVPGDTNGFRDNFVRDRQAGTTERVSVDSSGAEGDGNSSYASAISPDGRFVAFGSDATNLVVGDKNVSRDVFLRDRQAGTTERISVDSAGKESLGPSDDPSISADGRFVAFDAWGPFDPNDVYDYDIYVRDRQNGKTSLVSVDSAGNKGDGDSTAPSISAFGRYVAFESKADNLVAGDTNGWPDIFVRDRNAGTTARVSVDSNGGQGDGDSYTTSLSPDGRFVSFDSWSGDLVAGDTNGTMDAFVHGAWLTLEADPTAPPAGATLSFTTWTGLPSGASLLVATAFNGAATFLPVVLASFDSGGRWNWSATVPAGLSGVVASFTTFGIVPTGKVDTSNEVDVTFQ
jgi:hypothetical protein